MSNASGDDTTQEIEAVSMKKPCDCCGVEMEVEHEDVDFCDACAARFSERIANHKTNCVWCGHKLFRARSPASGDDEELKEALKDLSRARGLTATVIHDDRWDDAISRVESLFGRIREERDRLKAESGVNQEGSTAKTDAPTPEEIAIIRRTCEELATAFDSLASVYPRGDARRTAYEHVATDCRGAIRYGWLSVLETLPNDGQNSESASVVLAVDPSRSTPKDPTKTPVFISGGALKEGATQ